MLLAPIVRTSHFIQRSVLQNGEYQLRVHRFRTGDAWLKNIPVLALPQLVAHRRRVQWAHEQTSHQKVGGHRRHQRHQRGHQCDADLLDRISDGWESGPPENLLI
ncbi:hypothetical protein EVAR_30621_1 [Eumeta japonica]|uniref:Uncharacterized protein n=1 Tax=Eumeta variegata TaxID=151549 RepID=A0A4C1W8Z9_EUMVA|nr:hypothetical protein EVAR_30621_1 [Eumeta japonica]